MVLILNLSAIVEHFTRARPADTGRVTFGMLLSHADRARLAQAQRGRPCMMHRSRVLVVDDSALMRKLIPQILETRHFDPGRRHRHGRKFRPEEDRGIETPSRYPRSGNAGHGWHRHAESRSCGSIPVPVIVVSSHSTEGASVTLESAGSWRIRFRRQAKDVSARMPEIAPN